MTRLIGVIIAVIFLVITGRHDKKLKVRRKKIFDNAQAQMHEFSTLMKGTKVIKTSGKRHE